MKEWKDALLTGVLIPMPTPLSIAFVAPPVCLSGLSGLSGLLGLVEGFERDARLERDRKKPEIELRRDGRLEGGLGLLGLFGLLDETEFLRELFLEGLKKDENEPLRELGLLGLLGLLSWSNPP